MATKKIAAGTYRFKDKLTIPSWLTDKKSISIDFTTPTLWNTGDVAGVIIPSDGTDSYDTCILSYSDAVFTVIYKNSENLSNSLCYNEEKAWNALASSLEKTGFTNSDIANGYGQTITVTEDTEVDDDVFDWLTENLRDKIFTRLYLGDVVYSSGGKCFKRLVTEIPNVVGGWLFNEVISDDVPLPVSFRFTYNGLYNVLATAMEFRWFSDGKKLYYELDYTGSTPAYNFDSNEWSADGKRYISIVDQPTNAEFIQWLIRNAKRR